jgi:hypothetical protein
MMLCLAVAMMMTTQLWMVIERMQLSLPSHLLLSRIVCALLSVCVVRILSCGGGVHVWVDTGARDNSEHSS